MENGFLELKKCIGSKIIKCSRNFTNGLNAEIPVERRFQESDGEILIELSNGQFFLFSPDSENFSIKITEFDAKNANELFVDVSSVLFWQNRLNLKIQDITKLYSKFRNNHFGIKITLNNDISFKIIYESENQFDSDLILITDGFIVEDYER
jgi:hypothetical protein